MANQCPFNLRVKLSGPGLTNEMVARLATALTSDTPCASGTPLTYTCPRLSHLSQNKWTLGPMGGWLVCVGQGASVGCMLELASESALLMWLTKCLLYIHGGLSITCAHWLSIQPVMPLGGSAVMMYATCSGHATERNAACFNLDMPWWQEPNWW